MAFSKNTIFTDITIKKKFRVIATCIFWYGLVSIIFSFSSKLEPENLKMVHSFVIIIMGAVFFSLIWLYYNKKEKLM